MSEATKGRVNRWLPVVVGIVVTTALMLGRGLAQSGVWTLWQSPYWEYPYFATYGALMLISIVMVILGGEQRHLLRRTGKAIFIGGVLLGIIGFMTPAWLLVCELYFYLGIPLTCL